MQKIAKKTTIPPLTQAVQWKGTNMEQLYRFGEITAIEQDFLSSDITLVTANQELLVKEGQWVMRNVITGKLEAKDTGRV